MLAFAIIYLCLQQFEGNVVYPKIVGKSVGIGGLFVLLGITIFGNLWGVVGVLIGVPLTALIYAVFSRIINIGLYQKHIEVTYNNLYKLDENGNRIDNKVKPKRTLLFNRNPYIMPVEVFFFWFPHRNNLSKDVTI